MSSDIQVQKLFLYDPAAASTFTDIYVGAATAPDRQSQRLIVLIDYQRTRTAHRGLLEGVLRNCVRSFEASRHTTPELVLESVLESLNIALPQLAPAKDASWLESLNLLVAISDRGQVHFSNIGDVQALLVQYANLSSVSEPVAEINPLKLFSHVTSGLLEPGASMLFTTTALLDYIAEDKIRRLLSELPPRLAEQQLTRLVSQVPASVTFAAVVIKAATEHDALAERGRPTRPQVTAMPYEEPIPVRAAHAAAPAPLRAMRRPARGMNSWLLQILRNLLEHTAAYFMLLVKITQKSFAVLSRTVMAFISPEKRQREEQSIIGETKRRFTELHKRLQELTRFRRVTIYVILCFLFLLLNLIVLRGQTRLIETVRSSYNEALASVAGKKQAVDAALIYGNDAEAEQLLMEIGSLLASIRPETQEQQNEIGQLMDDNERSLLKARRINEIPSPLVGAELSLPDGQKPQSLTVAADGTYYVVSGQKLYRFRDEQLTLAGSAPSSLVSVLESGAGIITVTADGALLRLKGDALEPIALSKPAAQQGITAVSLYANNLYILDRSAGAIFRYEGSSTGSYRAGTVWRQDPERLSSARDLTVDGNIYVTTDDGAIFKFSGGEREDFEYQRLRPALGPATSITTTKESNYLYLLDPQNRRIVILDKQGSIKDQFTSKQFSSLRVIAITPGEASLAVLNDTIVYLLAIKK